MLPPDICDNIATAYCIRLFLLIYGHEAYDRSMSKKSGIEHELARLTGMAPMGYFVGLHIRFAVPLITYVTYPDDWKSHYNANAYHLRDPMVAWGFSREGVIRWSDIPAEVPDTFGILDEAAQFGLIHGICCSFGPIASRTIVSAARENAPFTEDEMAEVNFLTKRMHKVTEPPQSLTQAQIAALQRIEAGDQHEAAAQALGISTSALKARLASARDKLMCRTTAETLQKAKDYGLM